MLDRASTFAKPEIVELLKNSFIPVAIDQAYQRRQKDTEGEFYRKIASQSRRNDFSNTTQGFYVADSNGKLYFYNNNRDPAKLLRLLQSSLNEFSQSAPSSDVISKKTTDVRWNPIPPVGGLVVRVNAKVLAGYEEAETESQSIFQNALSRDNLWITQSEHESLVQGMFPETLQRRIARFHLVDNTRGEPPMWRESEIRELEFRIEDGLVLGQVHLATKSGDRSYRAQLRGEIAIEGSQVTGLQLVCLGQFQGEGRYTRGAPEEPFPLAIAFNLADGSDLADRIPPQGSRGWVDGYLRLR